MQSSFSVAVTVASLSLCCVFLFFYLHCLTSSWSLVLVSFRTFLMRFNHRLLPFHMSKIVEHWQLSTGETKVHYPNCSHRSLVPSFNCFNGFSLFPWPSPIPLPLSPPVPSVPTHNSFGDLNFTFSAGRPILLPISFTVYTPAALKLQFLDC